MARRRRIACPAICPSGTSFTGALSNVTNSYAPGNACDVVLMRVYYKWPIQAPGLDWFLINMANNSHLLTAAMAFRNEPYSTTTGGC